jgi:hypothetical protein
MTLKVMEFATTLLLVLVVGVFWGTWLSFTRTTEAFSAEVFLAVGKRMITNLAIPMRILTPLTLLSMAGLSMLLLHEHHIRSFLFVLGGCILIAIAITSTVIVNVPIDNQIKRWTVEKIPANWEDVWWRWSKFHALRTALVITSLISVLVAVLK